MTTRLPMIVLGTVLGLAGCATPPVTAETLPGMSSRQVCREIGVARFHGNTNIYALAQDEAERRIAAKAISRDDCDTDTRHGYQRAANIFATQPISR